MQINSFRFTLREFGGALGDLGIMLPLMAALILVNGLNVTLVMAMVGLCYIGSGLYYRLPTPVQPLKVAAAIAISLELSAGTIGAAGLIMGGTMLFLSFTNLVSHVFRLFPVAVIRGIQLSVGIVLIKKGVDFALSEQTFIGGGSHSLDPGSTIVPLGVLLASFGILLFFLLKNSYFPASLAIIIFGLGFGFIFNSSFALEGMGPNLNDMNISFPSGVEFWAALTLLVIPQLPLTMGNAVIGTADAARVYYGDKSKRVSPRALACSMGVANVAAGVAGAMPICHGSGGLTAHYKLGARTGGANLMIGALFLILGLVMGGAALSVISLIPLAVLGVLLCVVGLYHALLARYLRGWNMITVAVTVATVTTLVNNLAAGFGAGIILYYILGLLCSPRLAPSVRRIGDGAAGLLSRPSLERLMGYRPMLKLRSWAMLLNNKVNGKYNAASQ